MLTIPDFELPAKDWVEDKLLWGKKLAAGVRLELKEKVALLKEKPGLAVLLVGEDSASQIYVKSKEKSAVESGFHSVVRRLPETASKNEILNLIHDWNQDDAIHGILVQLPLPAHLPEREILQSIHPAKDVDGFHYENVGRLACADEGVIPCTPLGMMVMLKALEKKDSTSFAGKKAVVLGRSNIVGKPMAHLLLDALNCTVTVCHSRTKNMEHEIGSADILVSAIGVMGVVKPEWIKPGAIVLDVGIHRTNDGLCGDIPYKAALPRVSYITPVPGGIGPMTIAMLLYNTYHNALQIAERKS